MAYQTPIVVTKALERIHRHEYVLPAIQREFVWGPAQIARLFDSLLRGYPIGTFLFWNVIPEMSRQFTFYDVMRDYHELKNRHSPVLPVPEPRPVTAILDGQQRLSSLNVGLCGSYAAKLPYKRASNPEAYAKKFLYLDLCFAPTDDEEEELEAEYRFEFLTPEEAQAANAAGSSHWYPANEVLDLPKGPEVFRYVQKVGLAEHPRAYFALEALRSAVHDNPVISFYEEEEQSLSKVLDIFVRVNSGGTVLSKSDLLLSIATAQWPKRDARDAIHGLVDDLNTTHFEFTFTKDIVLKAGLVMTDIPDTTFKVENFTRPNMAKLDDAWDNIDRALRLAAKLLGGFGFSSRNLSANTVLIPVADYLYQRAATESFLNPSTNREEHDRLRGWVIRTLIKPGVWGSGLDTFVKAIRRVMREHDVDHFPVEAIESEMARLGKSVRFDAEDIEDLVDTPYRSKRVFPLLTLLYPGVDVRNEFHEDHLFPQSRFTTARLKEAGVHEEQVDGYLERWNRLPNLQLLEGPINTAKLAALPLEWATSHLPNTDARNAYLAAHDMHDLPGDMTSFLEFYESRRARMVERLTTLLGTGSRSGVTT